MTDAPTQLRCKEPPELTVGRVWHFIQCMQLFDFKKVQRESGFTKVTLIHIFHSSIRSFIHSENIYGPLPTMCQASSKHLGNVNEITKEHP